MTIPINWWAILVTTIISGVIGHLWFGPIFGRAWMATIGIEMPTQITPDMKKKMIRGYSLVMVGALVMNFVLLHAIVAGSAFFNVSGVSAGIQSAIWNWLGFVAPVTIGSVLWENRPWKYWFITIGYYLVVLLVNGIILSVWR